MDFQKLPIKKFPSLPLADTQNYSEEASYWKSFRNTVHIKEFAAVTSVDFSPVSPYDFCIAASTRIQIYSTGSNSLKKTISRFQDVAKFASYRSDGKLIVAGDASGNIQVFDTNTRTCLRSFKAHSASANCARFLPDNTHLVSVGDDKAVKIYDIPSQSIVSSWDNAHADYIKSVSVSRTNPNLFITSGYDHVVKVWDRRSGTEIVSLSHQGHPVESALMFPGESLIASCAGNQLFIWDLLGSGSGNACRLLHSISNHQKTISALCLNHNSSRLITASLDHHVKIYDVSDYNVVYSLKYPSPVLSVGLSPRDTHLVTGMVSGLISVRERKLQPDTDHNSISNSVLDATTTSNTGSFNNPRPGTRKFFMRGRARQPANGDLIVTNPKHKRLTEHEKLLKKYEYSRALDSALSKPMQVEIVMALLEELRTREEGRPLKIALSSRDDISLEPIMKFILTHLQDSRFSTLLMFVLDLILDMYSVVAYSSPVMSALLRKIRTKTQQEIRFQKQVYQMMGVMEMVMSARK